MNLITGTDSCDADSIVDGLKQIELLESKQFLEKNPEVNLPSVLGLDSFMHDFPPLVGSNGQTPLKEKVNDESWVSIVSKDKTDKTTSDHKP